jgi:SAM-dependent methyltransferase
MRASASGGGGFLTVDEVVAWFKAERKPSLSREAAVLAMNTMHPRTVFVKTLAHGARLLDMGAGNGGLEVFRRWPPPPRTDLRMYAYSLEKGERFDAYDGHELGNWELGPPAFAGIQFDALFCSHFIEHLADPSAFLRWSAQRLAPGGRLYLEWPSPFSALLPRREDLSARGIKLTIANFHDDRTHRKIHDRSQIVDGLLSSGFFIEAQGYVSLPFLEEELLAHFAGGFEDAFSVQMAFWSKTRWAQYLVAVRR